MLYCDSKLILSLVGAPSFVSWLKSRAALREDQQARVAAQIPGSVSDRISSNARSLLALATLAGRARRHQEQIEAVRCMVGGLVQTPIVSQALRSQNISMKLKAQRTTFLRGAAYADAAGFNASTAQYQEMEADPTGEQ